MGIAGDCAGRGGISVARKRSATMAFCRSHAVKPGGGLSLFAEKLFTRTFFLFRIFSVAALAFSLAAPLFAQFAPAPGTGPGLNETVEAIESARVTTRILYITAHPDDESAAVLTYLARGLHADVALLSLTRGEGGQNALGTSF
jgi:hypothetical protein